MDRLISWLRVWLGISAESVSTHARILELEKENKELRAKLDEVHRFGESLSLQLDTLRNIMVIRPAEPKPVRVRNWTDAKQRMPDEMVGIMEAK